MPEREQLKQTIKHWLNSYREIDAERQQIVEEIRRLEALMRSPTAPNLDGMPKGSDTSNPVERLTIKHEALLDQYKAKVADMIKAQTVIEGMIEDLEPTERRLARFRYIDGLRWETVCEKMNYSWRQTHRIHSALLDKLVDTALEQGN